MIQLNLLRNVKISQVLNPVAAGTTDQTSSAIDMLGFESVMIIASIGTLTGSQVTSLKAQQSSDDAATDAYSDLLASGSGNMADGDSNKLLILDLVKPQKRYIKALVLRGTANAVINNVLAIQYNGRLVPTTQPASVSLSKTLVSPAEGTA